MTDHEQKIWMYGDLGGLDRPKPPRVLEEILFSNSQIVESMNVVMAFDYTTVNATPAFFENTVNARPPTDEEIRCDWLEAVEVQKWKNRCQEQEQRFQKAYDALWGYNAMLMGTLVGFAIVSLIFLFFS